MKLNNYIEHTLLKPIATENELKQLCIEAIENELYGVCVPPFYVGKAKTILEDTNVKLVTVVGFPLGYNSTFVKAEETKKVIENGADEIDIVVNISEIKSGNFNYIQNELSTLCNLAHLKDKKIKVIIETAYLNNTEIKMICGLCIDAGVDFVKTSTGFAPTGATVEHITLLRNILPENIGIKASGGIKTANFAKQLIHAGASRIGTSSGVNIVKS